MQDLEQTILSQYANSPTIVQLLNNMNAYLDPSANIDAFYDLIWNVDTAVGYGLDVWGRIVGVGRVLKIGITNYFGLSGPPGASGQPWNQAPFYKSGSVTQNYILPDGSYRPLIMAKALANISNATIPAINQLLINLFGPSGLLPLAGNSYCTDGLNMTMSYAFTGPLNPISQAIIYQSGVLPKPAGVLSSIVIAGSGLWNDGGVLSLVNPGTSGWPASGTGLAAGKFYSNGGVCSAMPGATFIPGAPPLYFLTSTSASLLVLNNGGALPWTAPAAGTGQLWLPGGAAGGDIWVA